MSPGGSGDRCPGGVLSCLRTHPHPQTDARRIAVSAPVPAPGRSRFTGSGCCGNLHLA